PAGLRSKPRTRRVGAPFLALLDMTRVAFITCASHSALSASKIAEDDLLAVKALAARDVEVVPWIWNGKAPSDIDLAVLRSPWDWTSNESAFDDFLASFETNGIPLENRNARSWQDKIYLAKLGASGARTVPTLIVEQGGSFDRATEEVRARGWNDLVMKPSIGAGGRRTVRFALDDAETQRALAEEILSTGALMIQPFLREIVDHGEWSLIFFSAEYSHALKKHPARDEFRVQDDFGGTVTPAVAPDDVIRGARKVLEASGEEFLYARVDGLVSDALGGFTVTELEVVEPELFFRTDASAPDRFARAVSKRLTAKS
ncbi:MAG: ATP-grasp domain-containing protein, partial [Polyangiaceae bacterium]